MTQAAGSFENWTILFRTMLERQIILEMVQSKVHVVGPSIMTGNDQCHANTNLKLYVPYSGNLSRVNTFANFAVSKQFVEVLAAKISMRRVVINGRVITLVRTS